MAEFIATGDPLSRLIQLQCSRYGIRLPWVGSGIADLAAMCKSHASNARIAKHCWNGLRELMQMPEMGQLPEPVQAQIMSIILKAQILTDPDIEHHTKKLAKPEDQSKGTA